MISKNINALPFVSLIQSYVTDFFDANDIS